MRAGRHVAAPARVVQVLGKSFVGHPHPKYARYPLMAGLVPSDDGVTVRPVSGIHYVECDVPPGQTLAEWRRERAAQTRKPPRRLRLRRRAALRALRRAWGLAG